MKGFLKAAASLLAAILVLLAPTASADPADGIIGDWLVATRDAVVRFNRAADGSYEARIVWQLHDRFGPEDGPDLNGKPATDRNNPDPALRSRTIDNLLLIWGLHYDPEEKGWHGGHVYDADDGHTYQCLVRLKDPDHLKLRGYIGISLLGGSSVWTRVTRFPPRPDEAAPAK